MIVLDEGAGHAETLVAVRAEGFEEEPPWILKDLRLDDEDAGEVGFGDLQVPSYSATMRSRYWPYSFFAITRPARSTSSRVMKPILKPTSSGQATFRPWRSSMA